MNAKTVRNLVFKLHRSIGLAVGLIAIVIGLTGSLLVFHTEISDLQQHQQLGSITPQGEMTTLLAHSSMRSHSV